MDTCLIKDLVYLINSSTRYKTLGSCCGHGKYKPTIVVTRGYGHPLDWFSQIEITRKKRFYKKDKQGYYFIPEVEREKKSLRLSDTMRL